MQRLCACANPLFITTELDYNYTNYYLTLRKKTDNFARLMLIIN